jgi:hypothetical protein
MPGMMDNRCGGNIARRTERSGFQGDRLSAKIIRPFKKTGEPEMA